MTTIISRAGLIVVLATATSTSGRSIQSPTFTIEANILGKNNVATRYNLGDKFFEPEDMGRDFQWVRSNQIGYVNDSGEDVCLSFLRAGNKDYVGVKTLTGIRPLCENTPERWETFIVNESDGSAEEPVALLRDGTSGQCAYLATDRGNGKQEEKYYLGLGDCEATHRANLVLALKTYESPSPSPSPSQSPVKGEVSPSTSPSPSQSPQSPDRPMHQVCDCNEGVLLDNLCYDSLKEAFDDATDDVTIHVGGVVVKVSEPIEFDSSITLQGHACADEGNRAKIMAASGFETLSGAMLKATHPDEQNIVFKDLEITSESEGQYVAAFHSLSESDLEGEGGNQKVQLVCNNIYIHDMQSQEPGVGIFLSGTNALTVDDQCLFENLLTTTTIGDKWAGGPAIAVIYLPESGTINIDGQFKNNRAFFPSPSTRHAGGGAIYFNWMAGSVSITAQFSGNQANQGGAIQIQAVVGDFFDNGIYTNNTAADEGNGARFGALGCIKLYSGASFVLNGSYIDNLSEGRGGAVGTNIHESDSLFAIQGTFKNNRALNDGGVWGRWSSTTLKGKVVIDINATIDGNIAEGDDNDSSVYNTVSSNVSSDSMSQFEWEQRTISQVINP
ncbi:hypothetical protein SARC_09732 [Sphaeroforma arctica JP610]|uniref:Right handed beta helix domain-containing protein n=1 Tax=Sphaeroforma arctica JP610 TaxID=667725 RepID=A0A0L0FM33_9EUKA|nr:hypothetical protein SARC_09732 [Sphaeroforma arctica JP610]KNC77820.1 hypothetical protein SARC_09732 [Sphaeroforma arctica JP610]|eukprot:XP_014151722.1 hypothetical protein SARC_09732 [Sphaeroforma arctica JP610]